MPIRVAVTDDHPMIVQGLRLMLSNHSHIQLTAVYQNGAELLEGLTRSLPDVLLLDIQLPDKGGDELIPFLLEQYPDLHILVITNFNSTMYATKMLWAGAKGFLLKTTSEPELIKAIEAVHAGEVYIEKKLAEKISEEKEQSKRMYTGKISLTDREKEILQLIVEGKTDAEIGQHLFLGTNTVRFYRNSMLLKLDVPNTASLVAKALKMGWAK